MSVFVIPPAKLDEWHGTYNGQGFQPVEDANGNYVVSAETSSEDYPFNEEMQQCDQITYAPKPFSYT